MKNILFVAIGLVLFACGTTKQLSEQDLTLALASKNYAKVYESASVQIAAAEQKGAAVSPKLYALAGESALELGKKAEAFKYLETALEKSPSDDLYTKLASAYGDDYQMKRIDLYKNYLANNKDGALKSGFAKELLLFNFKRDESQRVLELWEMMQDEEKKSEEVSTAYLSACKVQNDMPLLLEASTEVNAINPNLFLAKEYKAFAFYNKAEDLYQSSMKAYKKKKTRKQYKILLADLKKATVDYKQARDLYEALYKEQPKKMFAKNLSNIYLRLENKSKSNYWAKKK